MTKSKILLLLSASLSVLVASSDVSSSVSPSEVAAMQKQIADLQKQLTSLVKQLNEVKAKTEQKNIPQTPVVVKAQPAAEPASPKVAVAQENAQQPQLEKGYIALPGTTAALKISGMIKLDMIRDTRAHTSEQTNMGRLPYALQMRNPTQPNTPTTWKDHYNIHGKQSRLRVDMNVKNKSGSDVKAYVEGDFFGVTQWGDAFPNGTASNNGPQSSNAYNFRVRHAIFEYAGLEAGHTTTTFHLEEAILPSVDLNGINGGYVRHALIRYTHKLGGMSISAAAEQCRADYITYTPTPAANTPNYVYNLEDSGGNLSKQERPDLIVRLKYNFANGNALGLGIINRDLRVKNNAAISGNAPTTVDGKSYILNAWGLNLAAKVMTFGQSYFTGGITTGKGMGWYILDAHGRSALFDPTASEGNRYKLVEMSIFWAGYSHFWCPQWQTNIGFARVNLNTQGLSNARKITQWFDPGLDKTYNKFIINTMYMPEENLQFGLEYFVLERKSTLGYIGLGHRLQFGASYKF